MSFGKSTNFVGFYPKLLLNVGLATEKLKLCHHKMMNINIYALADIQR